MRFQQPWTPLDTSPSCTDSPRVRCRLPRRQQRRQAQLQALKPARLDSTKYHNPPAFPRLLPCALPFWCCCALPKIRLFLMCWCLHHGQQIHEGGRGSVAVRSAGVRGGGQAAGVREAVHVGPRGCTGRSAWVLQGGSMGALGQRSITGWTRSWAHNAMQGAWDAGCACGAVHAVASAILVEKVSSLSVTRE